VSDGQSPRDWDKELAQIDKLMATGSGGGKQPAPAPAGAAAPASRERADAGGAAVAGPRRGAAFFTWLRLLLGLLLGAAITQWPYQRGCGVLLFGYLLAVAGVIVAGVWSALSSWRTRSGLAHALSLVLCGWGCVLGAREVLPRVGYARSSSTWLCPAGGTTAPAAPTAPAPATPSRPQGAR
jgi:hypothetical protein